MSRYSDTGAYEVGNVFINTMERNVSEGVTGIKRTPEQNSARALWMRGNKNSVGRRWMNNGIYATVVSGKDVERLLVTGAGWKLGRTISDEKRVKDGKIPVITKR